MNFADNLFEYVFESNQAEQAAELINDNGHAGMASAKLFEQFAGGFGFWNDEHFAQNAAQIEWRRRQIFGNQAFTTLQNPEHILDMNEAENVIESSAKNRNARALRGGERAQHFIESGFDAQDVHIGSGHHNFPYLNLAKFYGAEDNALFAGGEEAAFARVDAPRPPTGGMGRVRRSWTAETTRCRSATRPATIFARALPLATS